MTMWHEKVMVSAQAQLLRTLGPVADRLGYYLAGGTAVALHLGHRQSIDFDWFAEQPVTKPPGVRAALQEAGLMLEVKSAQDTLVDGAVQGIRTTFIEYAYQVLAPAEPWDKYGCRIASLADLACMKLWAVANRGSRKDFIDIYAILHHGAPLAGAIQDYRRKYAVRDTTPVMYGLAYFDDAEKQDMPKMLIPTKWAQMKTAIQKWTREAAV